MLNNFEYTFFHKHIANKFSQFIKTKGFNTEIRQEEAPNEGYTYEVSILEMLDDEAAETFEEYYSELLFGEEAALVEGNNDDGVISDSCGVQIQLNNGSYTTIAINPEIMNKILSVLSIDELQSFLAKVAEDIEEPKTGPVCSRKDLP